MLFILIPMLLGGTVASVALMLSGIKGIMLHSRRSSLQSE